MKDFSKLREAQRATFRALAHEGVGLAPIEVDAITANCLESTLYAGICICGVGCCEQSFVRSPINCTKCKTLNTTTPPRYAKHNTCNPRLNVKDLSS